MESNNSSYFKITQEDLKQYLKYTNPLFKSVKWKSNVLAGNQKKNGLDVIASTITNSIATQEISLANHSFTFSDDEFLLPDTMNTALNIVLDGFKIGIHISKLYSKASGFDIMQKEKAMSSERQVEFRKKLNLTCAIQSFVTAYYIVFNLSQYKTDQTESIQMQDITIPEMDFKSSSSNRNCLMFYYATYIEKSGLVKTEYDFLKMTVKYFQAIIDEIKLKENAFDYSDIFTSQNYKLEGSEFSISGFETQMPGDTTSIEFNKVYWNQIVGNMESKHSALRTIMGLLCYDIESQRNPMSDLGGFARTKLTYGPPGTGKSMEIAAIATELGARCEELGIPFMFSPMPDNIVSTYQGGSADKMLAWMKPLQDPTKIIFAPIDDAENNLEERSSDGVSAGVLEIVGVFLRMTEGAYAIDYGNSLINLYTNLPEMIDKAVLSRIQGRTYMGGAERFEDFLDQDHIGLIDKFETLIPGFINLKNSGNYEYMSAQNIEVGIQNAYKSKANATVGKVNEIIEAVKSKHKVNTFEFFAALDVAIKEVFPLYTSRDKRNIHSSVKQRMLDFDFPEIWMSDAEIFFRQNYEIKRGMLIETMKENLGGKSFSDIFLEESVSYFDNLAKIADKDFERKVDKAVINGQIQIEMQKRLTNK